MTAIDPQASSSAAAHASVSPSLELTEARQLRDALKTLLHREQAAMADFLVALADFDRGRGWERLGHASLFSFLNVELGLSKGSAYVRFTAARLLQAFPEVIEPIRQGQLCLSAIGELARVATPANFAAALPRFLGCSSREAREVAAAIAPREAPPVRGQVTRLAPVAAPRAAAMAAVPAVPLKIAPNPASVAAALMLTPVDSESVRAHELDLTHPVRVHARCDDVEPLTAELRRLHVTVSLQFLEKLDAARDVLSHAIPGATTGQVLEAALDLLLEKQAKRRGLAQKLRTSLPASPPLRDEVALPEAAQALGAPPLELLSTKPPPHRRTGPRETIPAAVRRAVWARHGGRCSWPVDGGGTCGSTYRLELDHVVPWALDGEPSEANLRLVCRAHNQAAARRAFGARCVARYASRR